jgi:hypothetical protein
VRPRRSQAERAFVDDDDRSGTRKHTSPTNRLTLVLVLIVGASRVLRLTIQASAMWAEDL